MLSLAAAIFASVYIVARFLSGCDEAANDGTAHIAHIGASSSDEINSAAALFSLFFI
ncbi:hypothetical protein SDC9_113746 [bioreactor metagenome]|uniref:Uncharacterized protein n=1 Tax=bioreactor metagenome TaxID=1076179 RepID=A0A645BYP9_9ZZZZ